VKYLTYCVYQAMKTMTTMSVGQSAMPTPWCY